MIDLGQLFVGHVLYKTNNRDLLAAWVVARQMQKLVKIELRT